MSQPAAMESSGFRFTVEARLARNGIFSGVFHVLSYGSDEIFEPPVAVFAPGKWKSEDDARRAAQEYAIVMAGDGALRSIVDMRQVTCR